MEQLKEVLHKEWTITNLREPTKIVGIEVTCSTGSIFISQERYIEGVLWNEGMLNMNPVSTLMDPNVRLESNPEGNKPNQSNSYAKLLGQLQRIANATCPDIIYAMNRLGTYTANPSMQHYSALKQILRYLSSIKSLLHAPRQAQCR